MEYDDVRIAQVDQMLVDIDDSPERSTFTLLVTTAGSERLSIIFSFDALAGVATALNEALAKFPAGRLPQ